MESNYSLGDSCCQQQDGEISSVGCNLVTSPEDHESLVVEEVAKKLYQHPLSCGDERRQCAEQSQGVIQMCCAILPSISCRDEF